MTRVRAALTLALASAAALAACGPQTTNPDASDVVPGDTITNPTDATDAVTPTDVRDGGTLACNTLPIEDLNMLGMTAGDTLTYSSNNTMAPSNIAVGVQVPAAVQVPGGCNFKIGHQRVFQYTPHTNSVLRVSTTNPGTDPGFDTVLFLLPNTMCPRTLRTFLGCNDDDPGYSLDQRRVSSTSVAFQEVRAGTPILIALGGFVPVAGARTEAREMGNFELTVQELAPIAADAACDRRRLTNACSDGTSCVSDAWPSDSGHCRADGTVAGSSCNSSGACTGAGLTCNTQANVCLGEVTTPGMACNPYLACGTGLTCVVTANGASVGTCTADGTAVGAACRADGTCDTGMVCAPVGTGQYCQLAETMNGACNIWDGACVTGQDCVTPTASGTEGTCTDTGTTPGSHCTTTCTATNTTCEMGAAFNVCQTQATAGQTCSQTATCGTTGTCYLTNLNDVYSGTCYTTGALGGACRTSGTACDMGTCSNMDPSLGRCLNMVADGAACTLTDNCGDNAACVQDGSGATFMGHCHGDGTVAGAPCRRTGGACDGGLTCSSWIPEEGVCQSAGTAGGMCNPRNASVHCPTGQVCRSSSITAGTCAAPTNEMEPNDTPSTSLTAVTVPAAINAGLASFDIDCYALSVPHNSGLYASVSAPSGVCSTITDVTELRLDIYRIENGRPRLIGGDTNSGPLRCPRVDAHDTEFAWARNTTGGAAETYYACVRNPATGSGPVAAYVISLDVRP